MTDLVRENSEVKRLELCSNLVQIDLAMWASMTYIDSVLLEKAKLLNVM